MALNSNHIVRRGIFGLSFYFFILSLPHFLVSFPLLFTDLFFIDFLSFGILSCSNVKLLTLFNGNVVFWWLQRTLLLTFLSSQFPFSFFHAAFILSLSRLFLKCRFMVCLPCKRTSIIIPVIYMMFYSFIKHFNFFGLFITFCFFWICLSKLLFMWKPAVNEAYIVVACYQKWFSPNSFHSHINTEVWIPSEID